MVENGGKYGVFFVKMTEWWNIVENQKTDWMVEYGGKWWNKWWKLTEWWKMTEWWNIDWMVEYGGNWLNGGKWLNSGIWWKLTEWWKMMMEMVDWMVEYDGKLTEWWNTDWMVESLECCSLNWFRLWCMLHPYNHSTKKLLCLVAVVVISEPICYMFCRFCRMLIL